MLRARDLFCLGERRSCSSTREMADSLLVRVVGVAVVIRGDLEGSGPGAAQACRFSEVRCPGEPEGIRSPGLQGTASIAGRGQCPLITLLASRHTYRRDAYAGAALSSGRSLVRVPSLPLFTPARTAFQRRPRPPRSGHRRCRVPTSREPASSSRCREGTSPRETGSCRRVPQTQPGNLNAPMRVCQGLGSAVVPERA